MKAALEAGPFPQEGLPLRYEERQGSPDSGGRQRPSGLNPPNEVHRR
jgi:hypothetical protein